jgi:DNA-binding IclR family transcriptional regulator
MNYLEYKRQLTLKREKKVFEFLKQKENWCIKLREIAEGADVPKGAIPTILERLQEKRYIKKKKGYSCCNTLRALCIKVLKRKYNG